MIHRRGGRWWVAVLASLALLGGAPAPLEGQRDATEWRLLRPALLRVLGTMTDPRLAEASGAAASLANPGLIWTIGDSGNPPELLAIDTSGTLRAVVPVAGVRNTDWEAVALGPCGEATCVYIADLGDNAERRDEVAVHRFAEPRLPAQAGGGSQTLAPRPATTLRLRYPDHPHDVEAVGVTPEGNLLLVTKGRSDGILVFEVPARAWETPESPWTATLVGRLPIRADLGRGDVVTDLAIDSAGTRVAIRTYRTIYLFTREADGSLRPDRWTSCNLLGVEPQGEAITWVGRDRLLLLSEKGFFPAGPVTLVSCRPE